MHRSRIRQGQQMLQAVELTGALPCPLRAAVVAVVKLLYVPYARLLGLNACLSCCGMRIAISISTCRPITIRELLKGNLSRELHYQKLQPEKTCAIKLRNVRCVASQPQLISRSGEEASCSSVKGGGRTESAQQRSTGSRKSPKNTRPLCEDRGQEPPELYQASKQGPKEGV